LVFKMNALVDHRMIRALYQASQAGVKVQLLVRGICRLRPGVPGVSENIEVTSIVGKFLEHSRVLYFRNGGDEQLYIGSADLMPRNIDHRVEALVPIRDPEMIRHIYDDVLAVYLSDNIKARQMLTNGSCQYQERLGGTRNEIAAQDFLVQIRHASCEQKRHPHPKPL
jgi:polyphosphate kinase